MSTVSPRKEAFKEGASEVKDKLRADVSNMARARRFISLAHYLPCMNCDGTGKQLCSGCGGEGVQHLVWNEENTKCPTCEGSGRVTCADCFGKGRVVNANRKKLKWVLGLGGVAWLIVLLRLMNINPLPEQQAKYLQGGGGGGAANVKPRGNGRTLGQPQNQMAQPRGNNGEQGQPRGTGRSIATDPLSGGGGGGR